MSALGRTTVSGPPPQPRRMSQTASGFHYYEGGTHNPNPTGFKHLLDYVKLAKAKQELGYVKSPRPGKRRSSSSDTPAGTPIYDQFMKAKYGAK